MGEKNPGESFLGDLGVLERAIASGRERRFSSRVGSGNAEFGMRNDLERGVRNAEIGTQSRKAFLSQRRRGAENSKGPEEIRGNKISPLATLPGV